MSNKDFNMRAYIDIVNESNKQLDELAPIVPIVNKAIDWAKDKLNPRFHRHSEKTLHDHKPSKTPLSIAEIEALFKDYPYQK
jgi:hypothetical protein